MTDCKISERVANCYKTSPSFSPAPFGHRRSRSVPDNELHGKILNKSPQPSHRTNSIVHIERRLHDQRSLQWVLEKSLGCNSGYMDSYSTSEPKPTEELIKEIALLEMEVMHLEQYLLSLYRVAFKHHQGSSLGPGIDHGSGTMSFHNKQQATDEKPAINSRHQCTLNDGNCATETNQARTCEETEKERGSEIVRVQNCANHCSDNSDHSIHLPREKDVLKSESSLRSLADHLGASVVEFALQTPDKLSEVIIRCMSSIYCKLANAPLPQLGLSPSSASSSSSSSIFSRQGPCDNWSPKCNEETINPCEVSEFKDKHAVYSEMIEIPTISVDDDRFKYAASMLQSFRSYILRLEKIDPRKMKHEEQLAFWINIHNALVMHASLAFGVHPDTKNESLSLKAAYNVGGHSVSAYEIKNSILGCRSHRTSSRIWTMFTPAMKYKTGNSRHAYAFSLPEPLVHFALCSGVYSDPAVRVYTARSIFQELEQAREEFIRANVSIHKESKIILPKVLHYYAKDASLDLSQIMELVFEIMPEAQQKAMKRCLKGRPEKSVQWVPYNSSFRYLIHREMAEEGKTSC